MIKKGDLIRKLGFHQTLGILSIQGKSITLRKFYEKLLEKGSFYNAFIRIKDEMISRDLIIIYYGEGNKRIKLTAKGIVVKQTLYALTELIG